MAHSILEFGEKHLIMRDVDLLEALTCMKQELESHLDENLTFLAEFLQSDMIHVSGGLDPDLNTHLDSHESREAFVRVIRSIHHKGTEHTEEKILDNLKKLQSLVG